MQARSIAIKAASIAFAFLVMGVIVWILWILKIIPESIPINLLYIFIGIVGFVIVTQYVSRKIARALLPKIGGRAYAVSTMLNLISYIIATIIVLSTLGIGPEVALAGGTITGLIVGLGAQPVLSNFFAGLLILLTRYVVPGDEIRIITPEMPYQWAFLPGYKYFSPDYIFVGYRGKVKEVGFWYTRIETDVGIELKVPNRILFTYAIVDYTSSESVERVFRVRYEFNMLLQDPDIVLERVKGALSDMMDLIDRIFINEQSDKEYYIVVIDFHIPREGDWRVIKSEILKRLIRVHRELKKEATAQVST